MSEKREINFGKVVGQNVFIKYNSLPQDEGAVDAWREGLQYIGIVSTIAQDKPTTGYTWMMFVPDHYNVYIKYNDKLSDEGAVDAWRDGLNCVGFLTSTSRTKPATGYAWARFLDKDKIVTVNASQKITGEKEFAKPIKVCENEDEVVSLSSKGLSYQNKSAHTSLLIPENKQGTIATTEDVKDAAGKCVTIETEQEINGYKKFNSVGIDTVNGKTRGNAIIRQSPASGNVIVGSFVQKLLLAGNQARPVYSNADGSLDDASRFKELALREDIPTFTLSGTTLTIKF